MNSSFTKEEIDEFLINLAHIANNATGFIPHKEKKELVYRMVGKMFQMALDEIEKEDLEEKIQSLSWRLKELKLKQKENNND